MTRRFRVHDRRHVGDLRGLWDFAFLGDIEPDAVEICALQFSDQMAVPGCFDATPAYAGKRGLVAYRTTALLRDGSPHRLIFDGVHHWCRVFVGGQLVGEHIGGFTQFHFDLSGFEAGETEIVILVDNRINYERCPLHLEHYDWYHYGGIARGAELHRLGEWWIDDVTIATQNWETRRVSVSVKWSATETAPANALLRLICDGATVWQENIAREGHSGELTRVLELESAALWSPDAPNLHFLHVQLGEDDRRERFGIRQVRVEGQNVLLNDAPLQLRGFCRHEMHPDFGHSQPAELVLSDVQRLRALGCNFVRGSHYPQDSLFLDLCDEKGLCVWCEGIGWQNNVRQLTDSRFVDAQLTHLEEMVAAAKNQASVIMWGVLNEGDSDAPAARLTYARLLNRLRALDPTRPVTFASVRNVSDICFDLADIVAINIYPGWYFGSIEEIPAWIDDLVAKLDAMGNADKPLLISEIGAGAVPGWRDEWGERWSEQYQARLLETVIRHLFVARSRFCGLGIWLYNDFRTPAEVRRPRSYNDKGVVDEYRRPKMAYETVRRNFEALDGKEVTAAKNVN